MKKKSLILVRGLGGTGKTALSRAIAGALNFPLLNRDDVKVAIRSFQLGQELETEIGYAVMNELARIQLETGLSVILDANARFRAMQDAFERMATGTNADFYVITCSCQNEQEWRRRIEARGANHPVSFKTTKAMPFEAFDTPRQLRIDSSVMPAEMCMQKTLEWLAEYGCLSHH